MVHILDLHFLGHNDTIASFLVETKEGPVLVETGPYSTFPALEKAVREKGYALSDIRSVLLTHIHFDHAGAAWAMAERGATIYVHPVGYPHLASPEKLYTSAKRIYGDDMERLWGEMRPIPEKQLVAVGHHQKVKSGKEWFKAWHSPGHATHHIAWQFKSELFAGDVAGIRIHNDFVTPPCPPPDIHVENWMQSIRMILNQRFDALYLTHYGRVTDVKPHLKELQARLQNWANWIKPFYDKGVPQEEIIPQFEDYVKKQLEAADIPLEDHVLYENANPAYMSVAGLMRYWKKIGSG